MKVKPKQRYRSKTSDVVITIISKKTDNGHWNSKKDSGGKAHSIHEGTLAKFWELI